MTPFFTAATLPLPDPAGYVAVGWVLASLVGLGSAVVLFRKVFGHEPPLHKEYVTQAEHARDWREIKEELARHAARRSEIYQEQKAQGEKLARLEVASTRLTADLADLKEQVAAAQQRIAAVPERTIGLLLDAQRLSSK